MCLTLFLRRWKPVRIFRFDTETSAEAAAQALDAPRYSTGQIIKAWSPFLILTAMVTVWSIKPFKALFAAGGPLEHWVLKLPVPGLDQLVQKMPPIVPSPSAYEAVYKFDAVSATGTAIMLGAVLAIVLLKICLLYTSPSPRDS